MQTIGSAVGRIVAAATVQRAPPRTATEGLMGQFLSSEVPANENKWQRTNATRWRSEAYDNLFHAAESELDPVKRAAFAHRRQQYGGGSWGGHSGCMPAPGVGNVEETPGDTQRLGRHLLELERLGARVLMFLRPGHAEAEARPEVELNTREVQSCR